MASISAATIERPAPAPGELVEIDYQLLAEQRKAAAADAHAIRRAWCYASGHIEFGTKVPKGALIMARGPALALFDFIESVARHGYSFQPGAAPPRKVPGTDCLLVPGVPAAADQGAALVALESWLDWLKAHPVPPGVVII